MTPEDFWDGIKLLEAAINANTEQLKRIAEHLEEQIKMRRGW